MKMLGGVVSSQAHWLRRLAQLQKSIVALFILAAALATNAVAEPAGGAPPPEWADMLAAHNEKRALHCVAPLTWNSQLAAQAQAYANQLAQNQCNLVHGTPESRFGAGENLANWFGQPAQSDRGTLDSWYGEIDKYNFDAPVLCLGRTDDPPGCNGANGHCTQVVWKDTRQLGCARATCTQGGQQGTVTVCRYLPPATFNANH